MCYAPEFDTLKSKKHRISFIYEVFDAFAIYRMLYVIIYFDNFLIIFVSSFG